MLPIFRIHNMTFITKYVYSFAKPFSTTRQKRIPNTKIVVHNLWYYNMIMISILYYYNIRSGVGIQTIRIDFVRCVLLYFDYNYYMVFPIC